MGAWSPSRSSCAEGRVVAVKRKNRRVPASIHRAAQPRHRPIRQTERPNSATRPSSFVAHDAFALDHDLHDFTCTQCSSKIKSFAPPSPPNILPDLHLASPPAHAITNANPGRLATTDGYRERNPTGEVWTGHGVMGTSVSQSFLTMKTVLTYRRLLAHPAMNAAFILVGRPEATYLQSATLHPPIPPNDCGEAHFPRISARCSLLFSSFSCHPPPVLEDVPPSSNVYRQNSLCFRSSAWSNRRDSYWTVAP